MRLLNVHTLLFKEFHDGSRDVPAYIIASHRWLAQDDEATYKGVLKKKAREVQKEGYRKVERFCEFIRQSECSVEWLWIDTCCIDKNSSAELQESINSMFRWYRRARCCLAFLSDVGVNGVDDGGGIMEQFRESVWFTRAWTLQELLAPSTVLFVDKDWQRIGFKGRIQKDMKEFVASENDLTGVIHEITGIRKSVLYDYRLSQGLSVEEKQEWVTARETTREEDKAYCLLGIFNVSMPLVYGEKRKAQKRLLKEIKEKEWEREKKREKKAWVKRRKEERKRLGKLEPVLEELPPPDVGRGQVQDQSQPAHVSLLPHASPYELSSTMEHRNAAIVSSLRNRWQRQGSRNEAIHSLAESLEKLGYSDPGASIHNALQHTEFRARQVQNAYFDMMKLDWTRDRAVQHMARILQNEGHAYDLAKAIILEYLMYDPIAVDAGSFPYIPAKHLKDEDERIDSVAFDVDEDATSVRDEGVMNGNVVSSSVEAALSGPGVSRQGERKASKMPENVVVTFESFVQIHLFC